MILKTLLMLNSSHKKSRILLSLDPYPICLRKLKKKKKLVKPHQIEIRRELLWMKKKKH
jgi:hypothetical protein